MSRPLHPLELLAPAKNADFGIAAIDHGADAVYIGGPAFGARSNAGNSVADIERLAAYAHRFGAKVFVTLNTILFDQEVDLARKMAWQIYEAGADALIVQDMGLLETDLPPIQLHASTQTDNRSPEKVRFLQDVGFSQVVLARELTLKQIQKVAAKTEVALEFFVHGALCVAYSGQCYISHAHTGRSANRGECSQACRLPYHLEDPKGGIVAYDKHLLSMKDNDQSANLLALAEAGISSFKVEGRLKDLSYVKNITAHYRQLLDEMIEANPQFQRASIGRSEFTFTPQPEKTFNRGATDYFVNDRKADIGAFETPAFSGVPVGTVSKIGADWFEVEGTESFHNGDGLSFFDTHHELVGVRINVADGRRLSPNQMPEELREGVTVYRNRDQAFERLLEKQSAERRIGITLTLSDAEGYLSLQLRDEAGVTAKVSRPLTFEVAQNGPRARQALMDGLGKLGNTWFRAESIALNLAGDWFVPASEINGLRREGIDALVKMQGLAYQRPSRATPVSPPAIYPESELTYLGNALNQLSKHFYAKHGVEVIADAYEANQEKGEVSLMITKHCLRYSFNLCPKEVKGIKPEPMSLVNGKERLTLRFDCKKCEMHVMGKMRKNRTIPILSAH